MQESKLAKTIGLATKNLSIDEFGNKVGKEEFDSTYSDVASYGRVQFWDQRYMDYPEPFDWYYEYAMFQDSINEVLPDKNAKIMIAGCGNSHFIEDMADDGYTGKCVCMCVCVHVCICIYISAFLVCINKLTYKSHYNYHHHYHYHHHYNYHHHYRFNRSRSFTCSYYYNERTM